MRYWNELENTDSLAETLVSLTRPQAIKRTLMSRTKKAAWSGNSAKKGNRVEDTVVKKCTDLRKKT